MGEAFLCASGNLVALTSQIYRGPSEGASTTPLSYGDQQRLVLQLLQCTAALFGNPGMLPLGDSCLERHCTDGIPLAPYASAC